MVVAFEDVPPPSDATFVALIALLLLFWLGLRVSILRRQMERRGSDEPPPPGGAWLRALARWPGTYPVIAVLAAGLVVLLLL